jgi:Leucine-rich repeat (LRR) protein
MTAFGKLKNLRELYLGSNQFNGSIPASLFELPHLEYLDLSRNLFQGLSITPPSNLFSSLRELHLEYNQLSGIIPASLFELPRLEYLDLSENLLQGHIPISSSTNLSLSLKFLKLSANNLNGLFDFFWLRNCTMLKTVDLSGNADLAIDVKFRRRVPPFQLRELVLSGCKMDNSIIAGPNFLGTQSHLRILDLSNNNLTGSIPSWINTRNLVYLKLANNSLAGSLNLLWQKQSNLEMIDISMNRFVGQLPSNISFVFPNLTVLNASYNIIFGHLPPSLCNIRNLQIVDLSNNKLTGEVPTCLLTDCSTLDVLKISNNNLGGLILGGASSLSIGAAIYLDSNNFEGSLPNNLSGNLVIMDLHDNKLSGKLDMSFWNIFSLQVLSVANNVLTGEIYPTICNLTRLQFLDISDNNFGGAIPNCDSKLTLRFLNMSSNTLSGFLSAFCDGSYVTVLDLRYNQFKGVLDWIHHLHQIYILLLGGNKFWGQIPSSLCQLQNLKIIDLSHNRLSGLLPSCIGGISFAYHTGGRFSYSVISRLYYTGFSDMDYYDPSFTYDCGYDLQGFTFSTKGNFYTYGGNFFYLMSGIDLSANMLSGEIPWEIGNLSHVKSLNLSHNCFTGQIPATFADMRDIESLDLSYNHLSGPIPWQLTQIWSLEVFFVAYNNLSGCIPNSGQFSSFGAECYTGNTNLHNLSHGNQCSPALGPVEEGDLHESEASADLILYITSAASFVLAFWATVAFVFCHPYGQRVILQL